LEYDEDTHLIRIANKEDLSLLNQIRESIKLDDSTGHNIEPFLTYEAIIQSEDQICFIFLDNITPLGFSSAYRAGLFEPLNEATLDLFIVKGARGRGIGSSLLDKVIEYVLCHQTYSILNAGVLNSATEAIGLYESRGFISHKLEAGGRTMKLEKLIETN